MADPKPPRRRVQVRLELDAYTWEDAITALSWIQNRLHEARIKGQSQVNCVSGGVSVGYILDADVNPSIDAESFQAECDRYVKWLGAEARRKREDGEPGGDALTKGVGDAR